MNKVLLPLQDNSFVIELSKEKRLFGYSQFGEYICKMRFLDSIGIPHVEIVGNEKQFFDFMNLLFDIDQNSYYYPYQKDMISYFATGENTIFIYAVTTPAVEYPIEDDELISFTIFEDTIQGRLTRMFFQIDYLFLEDFIYTIYQLLEDLDTLPLMGYSEMLNIMGEYDDDINNTNGPLKYNPKTGGWK